MIDPEIKQQIIEQFRTHEGDSGSPEVQVALLTWDIKELAQHVKVHKKDVSSRQGLLKKVSNRNGLLKYLKKKDATRYQSLIKRLGLRR